MVVDAPLQLRVLLRTLAYAKAANLAGLLAPVVKARAHRGSRPTSDPVSQNTLVRHRYWASVWQRRVYVPLRAGPV